MALRVSFGDFELDEPRFELRQAGVPVEIQPKVLDLVFFLVKNAERVVTKAELLDNVWPGVIVTEASLSQAVSAARRALGDDGSAQSLIRTVRGRGFRFTADVKELGADVQGAGLHDRHVEAPPTSLVPPSVEGPPSSMGTFESARGRVSTTNTSLELETHEEAAHQAARAELGAHLFILCHADDPTLGGARYALDGIADVEIIRGTERAVERLLEGPTKRLVISIPGNLVSRRHAQLVCSLGDWQLLDLESRNGTYMAGERIKKRTLQDGDVFECGHTLFLFRKDLKTPTGLKPDADTRGMKQRALASLLPERQGVRHALSRIARSDLSVLISGESGTGKELAARAFHALSERTGPLVAVSCGALGEHPEAVLLGRAAAPGVEAEDGFLQRANGGSLVLDQVESLPPSAQAALVRVLETHEVVPVGGLNSERLDLRVIAVTTHDLTASVSQGGFRGDLLSRLSGFQFELPPLRERQEDFSLVLAVLLKELALGVKISPDALRAMLRYDWPGNIRELKQTLIAASAMASLSCIELEHLPRSIAG
ncbi:MAG: sigma 54-interacting transcriptional regulator [Polyangiaceae bacterium]